MGKRLIAQHFQSARCMSISDFWKMSLDIEKPILAATSPLGTVNHKVRGLW